MIILLILPAWVIFLNFLLKPKNKDSKNAKMFMTLCSLGIILIVGLRSPYVGSADTRIYYQSFETAMRMDNIRSFFNVVGIKGDISLLSEVGFYFCEWILARIMPNAQLFLLLTSAVIVLCTAKFIWDNSENFAISWLIFICLGSMTFAMNGMRQALAMSICLLSYNFARKKKLIPFLLIVFIAVLFHKSAMFFAIVYLLKNVKLNIRSVVLVSAIIAVFLNYANTVALLYDSVTGEDYIEAESVEGGGLTVILIYLFAIILTVLVSKRLRSSEIFAPLCFVIIGLSIYVCRFFSIQIYERMSYYLFYFVILLIPAAFSELSNRNRGIMKMFFVIFSLALYIYRIRGGAFADYRMFW